MLRSLFERKINVLVFMLSFYSQRSFSGEVGFARFTKFRMTDVCNADDPNSKEFGI